MLAIFVLHGSKWLDFFHIDYNSSKIIQQICLYSLAIFYINASFQMSLFLAFNLYQRKAFQFQLLMTKLAKDVLFLDSNVIK